MPTRITADRKTDFNDLKLNQPEEKLHLKDPKESGKSLKEKMGDLKKDKRPVQFSTPIYNPITPETLTVVHTENSPATGGLFGKTRSGGTQLHGGVDIGADVGTGVLAAEDGVVTKAGVGTGYGNVIYVDHRGGFQTRYAHLSEMKVKVGDIVKKGELIGESGKTGNASGPDILPHLHFEIRKADENGAYQTLDPIEFMTTRRPDRDLHLLLEGIGSKEPNYLPKWLS